jgi:hypothetical protein
VLDEISNEDQPEKLDFVVYSSSLHLFKQLKESIGRCKSFSKGQALYDLSQAFTKVVSHYTMTLLKRKIPAKAWDCAAQTLATKKFATCLLADDQEMACVYIVNTCEEILEKLPQV